MTIYWLFFGFAAIMALAYPIQSERGVFSSAQALAFAAFLLAYFLIATLRFEVGGDWITYEEMYDEVGRDTLGFALGYTDPLFGVLLWVCAMLGAGVYVVNGVCALLLGYGLVRTATLTREPWLAILIAIPYLLIVVGMGYIRQGAAIGLILMAISSIDRGRSARAIVYLAAAAAFHSTASIVFPLFGFVLAQRYKAASVLLSALGALALITVIAPRLDLFERGYLDAAYDSQGTLVRLLMSVVPSALLLLRYRSFAASPRARFIWTGIALANFAALAALAVSPSSTAVDRVALYFAIAQIVVLGEIRQLLGASDQMTFLVRLAVVGLAAGVQVVFLVYAVHAEFWVPYKSVFSQF